MDAMQLQHVATFSENHAREVFTDMPEMAHAWGLLYCVDPNGDRWTLLGDHGWVASMTAAHGKPLGAEQLAVSPSAEWEVEMELTGPRSSEWPVEEFRPEWAIKGWPDEWSASAGQPMALYPWADLADALETGWPANTDGYEQEGGE
jgi:hypothetical protein